MFSLNAATTDNARNIVLALENLTWPHVGCIVHTFQLGVQKAMDVPEMARVLGWANESFPSFNEITLQITQESTDQEPPEKWQNKKGGLMTILEDIYQQQKII